MLSVVVCTRDRPRGALITLDDALAQLPAGGEVVIVDQSAEEAGAAVLAGVLARGDRRVRLLRAAPRGLPAARNLGLGAAQADRIVFFDDDVRLLPGCLAAHVRALDRAGVGVVAGRIVERSVRPNAACTANHLGPGGRVITNLWGTEPALVATAKGANMSFRAAALRAAGGFDPAFEGTSFLEDADASARVAALGWSVWFEPEAEVVHLSAPAGGVRAKSAREAERSRFRNTGYFVRRHRGRVSWPRLFVTFGAVAVRRAASWRDPGAVPALLRALHEGWALAEEQTFGQAAQLQPSERRPAAERAPQG